jgi:DNA-binding transcriptional MerR regulator
MPDSGNNPVEWTIRDVAAATGLTSRALRPFEQIRFYDDRELARLYRMLSLRALDLPLAEIQKGLDNDGDIAAAMRAWERGSVAIITAPP